MGATNTATWDLRTARPISSRCADPATEYTRGFCALRWLRECLPAVALLKNVGELLTLQDGVTALSAVMPQNC